MTLKRSLAAAIVCLFALVGCTAEDPSRIELKPGVCVAKEVRDQGNPAPDLSSIVECSSPHIYEVYDIIDLPRAALTGTTRQERKDNRDDLALPSELSQDSEQREVYEEFAPKACGTSLQRVTGYDDVELKGIKAADAQILPALRGVAVRRFTVMPETEWFNNGRRQVVCSAQFVDIGFTGSGQPPAKATSSPTASSIISAARSSSFPVGLRQCRAYDAKREKASPSACSKPHAAEMLFYFEAEPVFGKKFVKSLSANPTAKKFNRFDAVCTQALPVLLGEDYDRTKVRGFGSVALKWTETSQLVRCDVGAIEFRDTDLGPGSLVGSGDERIELVPAR
jgi:hypothetical protein